MTRCPSDLELEAHLLDPARSPAAGHVAGCARCQARLAEMTALGDEFRRELDIPPEPDHPVGFAQADYLKIELWRAP